MKFLNKKTILDRYQKTCKDTNNLLIRAQMVHDICIILTLAENKLKSLDARLFYSHESATRFWNKYTLQDYLKTDLYNHRGTLPNNFTATMPSTKQALKAVNAFKDEYLLDFINIEELDTQD